MPRTSRSSVGRQTPTKTSAPTPRLTSAWAPASGVASLPPLQSSRSQPASVSRASSAASAGAIPGSSKLPVTTPTDPGRRHASARAALFGIYPSVLAAWDTLALSSSLTASGRERARDADAVDTAAVRATSVSVAWLPRGLGRRLPMFITAVATILSPSVAQTPYCEEIFPTREQLRNLQALTESGYIASIKLRGVSHKQWPDTAEVPALVTPRRGDCSVPRPRSRRKCTRAGRRVV